MYHRNYHFPRPRRTGYQLEDSGRTGIALNKREKLKCLTGSFFLAEIARTTVSSKPLANVSDSIRVVKPGLYSLHSKEAVTSYGVSVTVGTLDQ